MSKAPIKISSTVHTILRDDNFKNFQIRDLRDEYLIVSPNCYNIRDAYQFIYRQINRLVISGVLNKYYNDDLKVMIYQKTISFAKSKFIFSIDDLDSISSSSRRIIIYKEKFNNEKKRLKEYETDFFACVGESEEYLRLYHLFPEMKEHLESKHLLAREHSSKLLGQIKALKSVLLHQQK